MKKILAVVLCLIVACTAFACLVSAEAEQPTQDPYETDIPQVITNIAGGNSADHQEDLHTGFKFLRIVTENLTRFVKDLAKAFDDFIDRVQSFTTENILGGIASIFKK